MYAFDLPGVFSYVSGRHCRELGLDAGIAPAIPGDLIAAVRARDVLVVTGTGVTGGAAFLEHAVSRTWDNPHDGGKLLLTRSLLIRAGTTWQLVA